MVIHDFLRFWEITCMCKQHVTGIIGTASTAMAMLVCEGIDREKLNRENYNWLYFRQYRENLDLRKFPAIRYDRTS